MCFLCIFLPYFSDKPVFAIDHSRGNAIELIEGAQAAVNMTATANPLPIEYEWSKESTSLELEKLENLVPSDHRLSVSGTVLQMI